MPHIDTELMTVDELIEKLQGMDAGDLPIKMNTYEGLPITVWTARKHVVTNEEGEIEDAYVVLNG